MTTYGLHHRTLGPADAPRLVLAHGFTQNSHCWGPFAIDLAADHCLVLLDAPGHGESDHDDADLPTSAGLMAAAGGRAAYLGYSMGGRTLLHLALALPELVEALVLVGATAGLDEEGERRARRRADDALADRLLTVGLATFLDEWLAGPLFAALDESAAARTERLLNRSEGLAASLRAVGTGTQEPLWERLSELEMPVLVMAGEADTKFTRLGRRLRDAIGDNAELALIPGGHAVHLENPCRAVAAVRAFLAPLQAKS